MKQAFEAPASPPLSAISSPVSTKRSALVRSAMPQPVTNTRHSAESLTGLVDGAITIFAEPPPVELVPPCDGLTDATLGARVPNAWAAWIFLPAVVACAPPPDARQVLPQADAERGRTAMVRAGCTSCHRVPGISWPEGSVGPALDGFARKGLIAGRLPNRPDLLAGFVRNAPTLLADTTMPAMPLSEEEAADVAAYLYTLDDA